MFPLMRKKSMLIPKANYGIRRIHDSAGLVILSLLMLSNSLLLLSRSTEKDDIERKLECKAKKEAKRLAEQNKVDSKNK
jgi:hypothetical protein